MPRPDLETPGSTAPALGLKSISAGSSNIFPHPRSVCTSKGRKFRGSCQIPADPSPRHGLRLGRAYERGLRLLFAGRSQPDFREPLTLAQGRIEQRAIWTTTRLNDYLNFPGVGQAFVIAREVIEKTTGKRSTETVYGLTDHTPHRADAAAILAYHRGHWTVENSCHYLLDWNWDEDRCTLRTGHGPANITALRRFAIGAIKAKSRDTVAATIQRLARNVRRVFDYLGMTENSRRRSRGRPATAG